MEKIVKVSGIDINFKSSGALPRIYRTTVGRDLFVDMTKLEKMDSKNPIGEDVMEIIENVAYAMARHANPKEKRSINEWLEQFNLFGISEAIPEIIALWTSENATKSVSKKNEEE